MFSPNFGPLTTTTAGVSGGNVTDRYRNTAQLELAAVVLPRHATVGAYVAATANIPVSYTSFTFLANQYWPTLPTYVTLAVAWNVGGTTKRYKFISYTNPALPCDQYNGEQITNPSARIEYWINGGGGADISVPALTVTMGGLFDTLAGTATPTSVTPCVIATTPEAGFAAYMTSCPFTT